MDWKTKLADAKVLAEKGAQFVKEEVLRTKVLADKARLAGNEGAHAAIEAHWPTVQRLLGTASSALRRKPSTTTR